MKALFKGSMLSDACIYFYDKLSTVNRICVFYCITWNAICASSQFKVYFYISIRIRVFLSPNRSAERLTSLWLHSLVEIHVPFPSTWQIHVSNVHKPHFINRKMGFTWGKHYFPYFAQKQRLLVCLFVLRFYGPVNPMGSCRARSVYLTTRLLGRLSPLSG